MAENIQRNTGRAKNFKLDRGGTPADPGPFIGIVKNNIDPTFSGRVQVYIEAFGGGDPNDNSLWRTVRYLSPFFGQTDPRSNNPNFAPSSGVGTFENNPQSYGMWMTPPDIGISVLCFFVEGDANRGYYVGCIPDQGINHMVPAVGASRAFEKQDRAQNTYFANDTQMPVVEINAYDPAIQTNPKFFDQTKPIHKVVAASLFQQGLNGDTQRGTITSSSQRETPSTVYGVSTPGRPIYLGGLQPETIKQQLASGSLSPKDVKVIARQGGHSLVMDDGDLEGKDALVRLKTAKGHQIMMNDEGNFFYIIHANGQTWLEFGKEGTVDVYSTNSVNIRTQGTINLHADQDINMYAGGNVQIKSKLQTHLESNQVFTIKSNDAFTLNAKNTVGIKSNSTLVLESESGSWKGGGSLVLRAGRIDLNSGSAASATVVQPITKTVMDDTTFTSSKGWIVKANALESIVTRAPTHEPYPYHNQGVNVQVNLEKDPTPPPTAVPVESGVTITRVS
jgi:hypothetical protein